MDTTPLLRSYLDRVPEPDDARIAAIRARLEQRMTTTSQLRRPAPHARRGFAFAAVGAVATACVVTGVVVAGPAPRASAEADRLLQGAASSARAIKITDGYWTLTTHGQGLAMDGDQHPVKAAYIIPMVDTLRVPIGKGTWKRSEVGSRPVKIFGGEAGRRFAGPLLHLPQHPKPYVGTSSNGSFLYKDGKDDPNVTKWDIPAELRDLPHDPDALLHELQTAPNPSQHDGRTERILATAEFVMGSGAADPSLQAAIFEALRKEPGLVTTDHVTDLLGRPAVALSADPKSEPTHRSAGDWSNEQLLLDPTTGRYLGSRSISTRALGVVPAGTVVFDTAVEQS